MSVFILGPAHLSHSSGEATVSNTHSAIHFNTFSTTNTSAVNSAKHANVI